jgi:DNA mismatch endonuclease (patch repair protein)
MDNMSRQQRSATMSEIRSTDSSPECKLRCALFKMGFRYRKNFSKLPGRPDIVLGKYKTIIFVNGCFWHQHPQCKKASIPKTNQEYWGTKLASNVDRDRECIKNLENLGWRVITVWECEINNDLNSVICKIANLMQCGKSNN